MNILTRQQVIDQLQTASTNSAEGTNAAAQLASWAFDQFYAEESGTIMFETGYRQAIGSVLDDLMFADQPGFHLSASDLRQLIAHLEQAQPTDDIDDEEDDDELDVDD
jgi:hypothetical protein